MSAASGRKLFVGAQAQEIEKDTTLSDNASSLTLALLAKQVKFVVSGVPGRIVAGEQLLYVKLSRTAQITAQVYVGGKAKPITWHRRLGAGTALVRIPLPATLVKGQHFKIVLRATSGSSKTSASLSLKR